MGCAGNMGGKDQAPALPLLARPLDRRDCARRALGHRRIRKAGIEILILFHEQEERALGRLGDQRLNVRCGDARGRLEDRAERGLVPLKTGQPPDAEGPVRRPGKGPDHCLRDLHVDQPRVLILIDVEDDRAGNRVEQVGGGEMAVGLEQHLERKGDVEQTYTPAGIEWVFANGYRRALRDQRARWGIPHTARRVVRDLLCSLAQAKRPEGEEIGGHDRIVDDGWRTSGEPLVDHVTQPPVARVVIVPEQLRRQCHLLRTPCDQFIIRDENCGHSRDRSTGLTASSAATPSPYRRDRAV